jgi:hypothetical protein
MEEIFAKCHTKNDKSWVDSRAEKAYVSSVYFNLSTYFQTFRMICFFGN